MNLVEKDRQNRRHAGRLLFYGLLVLGLYFLGHRFFGRELGEKCHVAKDCRSGACDCKGPLCEQNLSSGRCVEK